MDLFYSTSGKTEIFDLFLTKYVSYIIMNLNSVLPVTQEMKGGDVEIAFWWHQESGIDQDMCWALVPRKGRHGETEMAGPEYLGAGLQSRLDTCQVASDIGKEPLK